MKRVLILSCILCLGISVFCGCGNTSVTNSTGTSLSVSNVQSDEKEDSSVSDSSSSVDDNTLDLKDFYSMSDDDEKQLARKIIGQDFKDIEMTDTMGNKVKISDYLGKKIILEFADTTCQPCVESMAYISALEDANPDVVFLKYYIQDSKESLEYAYKKQNVDIKSHCFTSRDSYNASADVSSFVNYYDAEYFPSYYFINEQGKVSLLLVGGYTQGEIQDAIDNKGFKTKFVK